VADEPLHAVIPFELEAGTYAEDLAGWSTDHGIVLDFLARGDGDAQLVTSRIRLPATAALEVRQALDEAIKDYELEYGEIRRPRRRGDA
jgi:hypothetical protein